MIGFEHEPLLRRFKGQVRGDGTYRTTGFAATTITNALVFENSNHNTNLACRRLFRARGSWVKEVVLNLNQKHFIAASSGFLNQLKELYAPTFVEYEGWRQECVMHYADPHTKRDLRVQAYDDLFTGGIKRTNFTTKVLLYDVTYKMKKGEWAKFGKEPRMIGDLKVPASLQGFRTTWYLKHAQERDIVLDNGVIHFCSKPSQAQLTHVFDNMLAPSRKYFFACFSDDSVLAVRCKDGSIKRYDVDISSCDASHGPDLFAAYCNLADGLMNEDLNLLIDQLRAPVRIKDLASKNFVKVVNAWGDPTLYSGSTTTTSVNNFASQLIAYSIMSSNAETEKEIIAAAGRAGYLITLDKAERFEDVTFLKHSPVLDTTGQWRPLLNIGVLLRLSGTCSGDLPGRGSREERGTAFQKQLLCGVSPRSHYPLINNMRSVVKGASTKLTKGALTAVSKILEYKVVNASSDNHHYFHSEDVYRRYRLTPTDMDVIDNEFGRAGYGSCHQNASLDKILKKDYGLRCLTERELAG